MLLPIEIDILPRSDTNHLNPRMNYVLPVVLFGSAEVDVADVDVTELSFGPGGAAPVHDLTDLFTFNDHIEDLNLDGFMDLTLHFPMQDTGISCGDESASLYSGMLSGRLCWGEDSIVTVSCGTVKSPPKRNSRTVKARPSRKTDQSVSFTIE
jgi:hypothetical protein